MMEEYARDQASRRLNRLIFELARAAKSQDADSVHDLRVSIRRFTLCLKLFRQFLPAKECRKVRRRLRAVRKQAAEVRERDIAIELLETSGAKPGSSLHLRLAKERKQAGRRLADVLHRLDGADHAAKWRRRLEL